MRCIAFRSYLNSATAIQLDTIPEHAHIQADSPGDLPLEPAPLEALAGELPGAARPDVAADAAAHEALLQGEDGGLDAALLARRVVQLPRHDRRRHQHLVHRRDVVGRRPRVRRADHLVRLAQRARQQVQVRRQCRVQRL